MTEFIGEHEEPPEDGVGPQLQAERMRRGFTLEQVAAETRIPQRHLRAIESGSFDALPGKTYAIGFARTYGKLLGYDPDEVAVLVRAEMAARRTDPRDRRQPGFQPGDPARVPSALLSWLSVAAVVLLLLGGFFFMRTLFAPAAELPSLVAEHEAAQAAQRTLEVKRTEAVAEVEAPAGPVVFTAMEDVVWVKFYDASEQQLMQKEMARGESYTVPLDVEGPQLWTGRPDALQVTIGGGQPQRLARQQSIVRDVPVSAEALLVRFSQAEPASPTN